MSKPEVAVEDITQAIRFYPVNDTYFFARGEILLDSGLQYR